MYRKIAAISIFEHTSHWTVTWMNWSEPCSRDFEDFGAASSFVKGELL